MATSIRSAFGVSVRAARLARDWTQEHLGLRAGVSRSLVGAVERGHAEASIEALARIARALDGEIVVGLRTPLAIGLCDQRDAAHAACAIAARRALERRGFACVTEHPLVDGRLRGWIDLLAYDPSTGRVLVVEVKTELRDLGSLQRQVAWYARSARGIARQLGWRVREVGCLVVFLATDENDAALAAQRAAIEVSFPVRGRALREAIEGRRPFAGWGLSMIDPRRRGNRAWVTLGLDGRRRTAPYRSYADYMRVVRRSPAQPVRARRARRAGVRSQIVEGVSREPLVRVTDAARTSG